MKKLTKNQKLLKRITTEINEKYAKDTIKKKAKTDEDCFNEQQVLLRNTIDRKSRNDRECNNLIKLTLGKNIKDFAYFNLHSAKLLQNLILDKMKDIKDKEECRFFTIVHDRWNFGLKNWVLEKRLKALKRKVIDEFNDCNVSCIALADIGVYDKENYKKEGKLISLHVHGIYWGKSSKLEKLLSSRFACEYGIPVKSEPILSPEDLQTVVSYTVKAPFYHKTNREKNEDKQKNTQVLLWKLLQNLKTSTWEEFLIATGEGLPIKRDIVKEMRCGAK